MAKYVNTRTHRRRSNLPVTRTNSDPDKSQPIDTIDSEDQHRSQSTTSLKHSRSNEDFSKSPHCSPKPTRRCSLQYQSPLVFGSTSKSHGSLSAFSIGHDRKHHGSTNSITSSKDKKHHGSSSSFASSKDKKLHGSSSSFASSKDKKFHGSSSSILPHKDKSTFGSHSSLEKRHSHDETHGKKPHLWHPRKISTAALKTKFGHTKHHRQKSDQLSKLKKEKEKEALDRLKRRATMNTSWLTSSRYPILSMFGNVVSKRCKDCCCTIS